MKLFYEKYIKLAHIGKGANAHVYKVRHVELGYVRAIKILNEDIESKGDRAYQSFLKECKTLLAIGNGAHPNIIRIYGPDLIDNRAIVEMDYVQGTTLNSYIKQKGVLDYEEVKTFIHDIVGALAYTHHDIYKFLMNPEEDDLQQDSNDGQKYIITPEKETELVKKYGIAHNDLHSNNVMRRDYDGSFVLLDFGLAVQDGECIKSSRKSDGHPEYMAPEKFDSGDVTPRSDVYSLGILIYEALTGRPPFVLDYDEDGKVSYHTLSRICNEHHSQTPSLILQLRKSALERLIPGAVYERDYPEWLDKVVMKCLAKSPEDRYSDAKELLDDINWNISQETRETKQPSSSPYSTGHDEPNHVDPPYTGSDTKIDDNPVNHKTKANKNNLLFIANRCLIATAIMIWLLLSFGRKHDNYIPVEAIIIPNKEYSVSVGDSIRIRPKILPPDATDTIVNWVSSNPDVVKVVGNHHFKAFKVGTTNLIATSNDEKIKAQVPVMVSETVTQPRPSNGSNITNTVFLEDCHKSSSPDVNADNSIVTIHSPDNQTIQATSISIPVSIQESLNMLINSQISKETRLNSIPEIMNRFFESEAKIRTVSESDLTMDNEYAEDFLRRIVLSRRISQIVITKTETKGKITELSIKEIHK